ncbi:MAG TPA: L-threonylcarbamoyladenylate synthase [Xanthomonadales bacterium]|nr:L-threonylcarbamoyladenylate synthase [Xanthomonadales bacterium]
MSKHPPIDAAAIARAVAALREGDVVGMPTETVYGLAGDATNAQAVARIFALKRRPADHPLIVHLPGADALPRWMRGGDERARALAARFWPGPLTLIVPRAPHVSDAVTGGQDTVGLRVPAHPVALALLAAFGGALAAPSANRFGHISPTTAEHVRREFGDELAVVLDGGPCDIGIESTIVDLSSPQARVLRPGDIDVGALSAVIGPVEAGATRASPRVSGALASHYAPRTPAELVARNDIRGQVRRAAGEGERFVVLARGEPIADVEGLTLPADAPEYARHLYAALRELDGEDADRILVESVPGGDDWAAVRDRLGRACSNLAGEADST